MIEGNILGVDPGDKHMHIGVVDHGGQLLFAKTYDRRKHSTLMALARHETAMLIAQEIYEDIHALQPAFGLFEGQQVRTQGGGKGDPNDLLPLGFFNGSVATALQMAFWGQYKYMMLVRLIAPDWKGSIDADMFTRRTDDALTPGERSVMHHRNHNVLDAIALAKWGAERRSLLAKRKE